MKTCTKCGIRKLYECFSKNLNTKDKLSLWCKECKKEYYLRNHDKILAYGRKYNLNHLAERAKYKAQYDLNNSKKIKEYCLKNKSRRRQYKMGWDIKNRNKINEYHRNRKNVDVNYKITCNLRTRLNMALNKNFKVGSAVKDLGCPIDELKRHLEMQFKDGMSWNNHGKNGWHIDHIIPLSLFNLEDRNEFLKACHYTNLQPLWATENLSKGSR